MLPVFGTQTGQHSLGGVARISPAAHSGLRQETAEQSGPPPSGEHGPSKSTLTPATDAMQAFE